jgi:DNA segregation ATPase FtsK/SpoIIIE-like protein
VPDSKIWINDFKGDQDYSFLTGCARFARFDQCNVSMFYDRLRARQSGEDASRNMLVLYFDEFASYIHNLEKKEAEAEKKKLAYILMQGRSFRVHVIVALQRPDAQFLESRENFSISLGLGNLSKESRHMLFSEFEKDMQPDRATGKGYMLENGNQFQSVQVPVIQDMKKLHDAIKLGVTR